MTLRLSSLSDGRDCLHVACNRYLDRLERNAHPFTVVIFSQLLPRHLASHSRVTVSPSAQVDTPPIQVGNIVPFGKTVGHRV
jgi:hypothetical protein